MGSFIYLVFADLTFVVHCCVVLGWDVMLCCTGYERLVY
eukprot:gene3429-2380_t